MSDTDLGKALGILRHRREYMDSDVDAAVDRVLAAFDEQQSMVPVADHAKTGCDLEDKKEES